MERETSLTANINRHLHFNGNDGTNSFNFPATLVTRPEVCNRYPQPPNPTTGPFHCFLRPMIRRYTLRAISAARSNNTRNGRSSRTILGRISANNAKAHRPRSTPLISMWIRIAGSASINTKGARYNAIEQYRENTPPRIGDRAASRKTKKNKIKIRRKLSKVAEIRRNPTVRFENANTRRKSTYRVFAVSVEVSRVAMQVEISNESFVSMETNHCAEVPKYSNERKSFRLERARARCTTRQK